MRETLDSACGPVFPGAVAVAVSQGETRLEIAAGLRSIVPRREENGLDTVYDLASLTKPMVVGSVLALGMEAGVVDLEASVGAVLAPGDPRWKGVTVAHLAGHTSGLPAWRDIRTRRDVFQQDFDHEPGDIAVYSDLGYMALGWYLEERLGAPLDQLFSRVRSEFGLENTGYLPLSWSPRDRIAPTEDCARRERVVRGEVHDFNAWNLGGVAGHAGLFGTAQDVARWAQGFVDAYQGRPAPLRQATVKLLWESPSLARTPTTWRLCFDTVSATGSSAGSFFGSCAVGHLGFTGTSVWIDPKRSWIVVLLTNRVHPEVREEPAIKRFRPEFHDAVVQLLT